MMPYRKMEAIRITAALVVLAAIAMGAPGRARGAQATQWTRSVESVSSGARSWAQSTAIDPVTGDVIVAGTFLGRVRFEARELVASFTSLTSDGFVARYSSSGQLRSVTQLEGPDNAYIFGVATDAEGNAYVAGYFSGTATIGHLTLASLGSADAFVARISPSGAVAWARRYGGKSFDFLRAIAVRGDRFCVTGGFVTFPLDGPANFGGANLVTLNNSADAVVACYSLAGAHLGSRGIGGPLSDTGYGIALDDSNVYVGGQFSGSMLSMVSAGSSDAWMAKLDAELAVVWDRASGTSGSDQLNAIAVHGSSVVGVGYMREILAAQPPAVWVINRSATTGAGIGTTYATGINIPQGESADAVAIANGMVRVVGQMVRPVNFGGGVLPNDGSYNPYLLTLTPGLDYQAAQTWTGLFSQAATGVAAAGSTVAIVGRFAGTINFGSGPITTAGEDAWVAYLSDGAPQPTPSQPAATMTRTVALPTSTAVVSTPSRSPSPKATATPETELPACVIENAPCTLEVRP